MSPILRPSEDKTACFSRLAAQNNSSNSDSRSERNSNIVCRYDSSISATESLPANQEIVQVDRKTDSDVASISGYVTDPKGAVIPFAVVTLINEKTFEYRAANA